MPRNNFNDLRVDLADRVGEGRVAAAERAELELYELEQIALGDLRRARSLTQTQLASALGVTQAQVSRIEHQTDLFLSTLASYVEAMGGELDLIATFPDQASVSISIGELAANSSEEGVTFLGLLRSTGESGGTPDLATPAGVGPAHGTIRAKSAGDGIATTLNPVAKKSSPTKDSNTSASGRRKHRSS